MPNLSYENEFDLHENKPVGGTLFHMTGFTQRLVLTQRQKASQKWTIKYNCMKRRRTSILELVCMVLSN